MCKLSRIDHRIPHAYPQTYPVTGWLEPITMIF